MRVTKFYLLIVLFSGINVFAFKKPFTTDQDVFGIRVFIENKGQYNSAIKSKEQIKYVYDSGTEHIYFTAKGLVYKLIKKFPLTHEQREKMEKGKAVSMKPDEIYYVEMNWLNANENIVIEESEKQDYYFTYGVAEFNSYGYKKITYKNVYNNIDIEYIMPANKSHGIKYNVVVHPGADPKQIKIAYSGDVDKIIEKNGEIIVKTPLEDITEHSPKSFYDNNEIVLCAYALESNIISFNFPQGFNNNKTLVIDPWVTTLSTLLATNYAYDVDYDYSGNLFVYGGLTQVKVAKYSTLGALLWTFSGSLPGIPWNSDGDIISAGNFLVNKADGKVYMGCGFEFAGTRVIRLDPAGNYDNFITPPIATWRELWDMGSHCGTGKVYGLGGGTFGNTSAGLIDQITASVTPANFTGLPSAGQDVVSNAIDDNGNIFLYFTGPGVNNKLLRVNPAFNGNIWFVPSTYVVFNEAACKNQYVGGGIPSGSSNGFNCLAVNGNFLFYYDGFNLAAYDKATGIKLGFTTIAGQIAARQGGIAVDDCNNVYLGGNTNMLCYNYSGGTFNALASIPLGVVTPNQYVYDIKLDRNSNLLYVSGSGFAGTYNAAASLGCGAGNQFTLTSNCVGNNNGTGVASLTTAIGNPTINYIWTSNGNTVSTTFSTSATSNTVNNLPNGTYVVQMQINAPCGPVYVNTVTINCCAPFSIVSTATQVGCTNTVNAVSISIVGGGTIVPTVTWSPVPGAIAGNSLSASNLPAGITTISVSYGAGCIVTQTINMSPTPPPLTFTINNLTGSYSITCINPTINLQAVTNYTFGTLSYSWTSISFTAGTTSVSIVQSNTLNVTVTDPVTGCSQTQTVAVGINTTVPTTSVNPASQVITCNSGSPVTFSGTVSDPTVNIQHDWYSPLNPLPGGVPIATSNNTIGILSGVIPPGVYTLQTTNLVNGCKTQKTVTVTSLSAWPTFNVLSTTNFSVGCSPLNTTTIIINNPISTQSPQATCSYTFLAPSFTGAVTPSVVLGGNTSTVTTIPGTWTVIVQDNSNFCRTTLSIPIIQNTVAPNVSASMFTQTLTCKNPTIIGTGISTTPNTQINWGVPSNPPLLSTSTLVIGPANGPNTSTTSLNYATYTVIATNTVNACSTTSIVTINQNFRPPVSSPTISIGTPTAIFCTVGSAPVVLTTGASTVTSGEPFAFVANPSWSGPSPQAALTGPSSYSCYVPGIYTLTVEDSYNGCIRSGTINVLDRSQPPVITSPVATGTLDCGANQATLLTITSGTNIGGLMYWYYEYPLGAAFSPTIAPIPNGSNPFLSGTSATIVNVSMSGVYNYVITNTLTGCRAFGSFNVNDGGITADFTPDKEVGYAPLTVNFTNNSSSSLGSGSITSIWSFGNGTSQTTTTNINTSALFSAPGTYTVMLLTSKGSCIDTTYKIIKVDLPSKLEVPNIFTPNGDGSNDVFFFKVANMGEIHTVILDRWGNKVYETTSSTGNVAWDGKNFKGKDCADGVYFYLVKGTGKDSKEYEMKGNVSLLR